MLQPIIDTVLGLFLGTGDCEHLKVQFHTEPDDKLWLKTLERGRLTTYREHLEEIFEAPPLRGEPHYQIIHRSESVSVDDQCAWVVHLDVVGDDVHYFFVHEGEKHSEAHVLSEPAGGMEPQFMATLANTIRKHLGQAIIAHATSSEAELARKAWEEGIGAVFSEDTTESLVDAALPIFMPMIQPPQDEPLKPPQDEPRKPAKDKPSKNGPPKPAEDQPPKDEAPKPAEDQPPENAEDEPPRDAPEEDEPPEPEEDQPADASGLKEAEPAGTSSKDDDKPELPDSPASKIAPQAGALMAGPDSADNPDVDAKRPQPGPQGALGPPVGQSGITFAGGAVKSPESTPLIVGTFNPDPTVINNTIANYNTFPGGVLLEANGTVAGGKVFKIEYFSAGSYFLLNDKYVYDPMLDPEELAILYGFVETTRDVQHFGAVSVGKTFGIENDSIVALGLFWGDAELGALAYGYDVDRALCRPPAGLIGYQNPTLTRLDAVGQMNWDALKRTAAELSADFEPRIFIRSKAVKFKLDPDEQRLGVTRHYVDVHFQVFRQVDGKTWYADDQSLFAEMRANARWMADNLGPIAQHSGGVARVLAYGEALAFLRHAKSAGVTIAGAEVLEDFNDDRKRYRFRDDVYLGVLDAELGELTRATMLALEDVARQSPALGDASHRALVALQLMELASQVSDAEKMAAYRKELEAALVVLRSPNAGTSSVNLDVVWLSAIAQRFGVESIFYNWGYMMMKRENGDHEVADIAFEHTLQACREVKDAQVDVDVYRHVCDAVLGVGGSGVRTMGARYAELLEMLRGNQLGRVRVSGAGAGGLRMETGAVRKHVSGLRGVIEDEGQRDPLATREPDGEHPLPEDLTGGGSEQPPSGVEGKSPSENDRQIVLEAGTFEMASNTLATQRSLAFYEHWLVKLATAFLLVLAGFFVLRRIARSGSPG